MGAKVERCLSRQAMDKRIDDAATAFITHVAQELLCQPIKAAIPQTHSFPFNCMLIEDSSFCPMAPGNAESFPAHRNVMVATVGVKVDFTYDLITAELKSFELHRTTEQDKIPGKDLIDRVKPKDLILRKMGYFFVS